MFVSYPNDVDGIMVVIDSDKLDAMWAVLRDDSQKAKSELLVRFRVATATPQVESVIARGDREQIRDAFNCLCNQLKSVDTNN